jgi:hypothetical protein
VGRSVMRSLRADASRARDTKTHPFHSIIATNRYTTILFPSTSKKIVPKVAVRQSENLCIKRLVAASTVCSPHTEYHMCVSRGMHMESNESTGHSGQLPKISSVKPVMLHPPAMRTVTLSNSKQRRAVAKKRQRQRTKAPN